MNLPIEHLHFKLIIWWKKRSLRQGKEKGRLSRRWRNRLDWKRKGKKGRKERKKNRTEQKGNKKKLPKE